MSGQKKTMIKLNIHEAKTHISHYLEKLAQGETILLCKRNIPIAEIRPLPQHRKTKRPIGLAKGSLRFRLSFSNFFHPIWSMRFVAKIGEDSFRHCHVLVGGN